MFQTELLSVRRVKGKVVPSFLWPDSSDHAAIVIGLFQESTGIRRSEIERKVRNVETQYSNHKAVRGLAELMTRKCYFESPSKLDARSVRRFLFTRAIKTPLNEESRKKMLAAAAEHFATTVEDVDNAIYGDKESEAILRDIEKVKPEKLCLEYNREMVETILMKAVSMSVQVETGWRDFLRVVKRLGLMFSVEQEGDGVGSVTVDGPLTMHQNTMRYGERFAKLFRHIYAGDSWKIEAKVRLKRSGSSEVLSFYLDSGSSDLFPAVERYSEPMPSFQWVESWEPQPVVNGQKVYFPDLSVKIGDKTYLVDISRPVYSGMNSERDPLLREKGIPWVTVYALDQGEKPVKGAVNLSMPIRWESLYFALQREIPGGVKHRNKEIKNSLLDREIPQAELEEIRQAVEERFPDPDLITEYLESRGYVPSRILPVLGYRIRWKGLSMEIRKKG